MSGATLRQTPVRQYSRILGVGGVRGDRVVTNEDVAGPINSSDEWIRQRTGIVTRRRADPETSLIDLATGAAQEALAAAGLQGSDVDTVILSTVTYFEQTPAAAAVIADRIGAMPAAAYDISAACAGYCYGIAQADALVRSGQATNVLVIGAEKMSDFIDPTDRTISFLLGDGAGAAVIGPADFPGIGPTIWGSAGQGGAIGQTHSWLAFKSGETTFPTLRQDGQAVFKWAVWQMAQVAQQAIEAAGLTPDDIDVFVPHQANMRIIDQMIKTLKLPARVVVGRDIADTGNTSAASIPLATERLLREGQAKTGDICLQIGFGAGLVFAAQVVVLP